MLSAADEMEAKQRTEEQIKARVKKLGFSAASAASPGEGGGESADEPLEVPGTENRASSGEEDHAMGDAVDDVGADKPMHVRRLERKNKTDSDDDSEGLFSSTEVCTMLTLVCSNRALSSII